VEVRKSGTSGFFGSIVKTPAVEAYGYAEWNFVKTVAGDRDQLFSRKFRRTNIVIELWDKKPFPEKDILVGRNECPHSLGSVTLFAPRDSKTISAVVNISVK